MVAQVKDVMGVVAIAVHRQVTFTGLMATMRRFKVNTVAVIDTDGRPVGMASEEDLLSKETDTFTARPFLRAAGGARSPRKPSG
ncbi:CBS domain-containing protein [Streptosporangium sp. NBC_01756]|uniref:CBS domain-containing protein n=1 Tax=Streptosporangium sp. NBC_01756 TaxID=2975950 RepID=UPI002DDB3382|nr:CBS domain-containing protein [Streptosporangium sp. NBC_01756]WSC86453.1 CBS domain-containing protein [Streptosporangium sp. NBC_01756]